MRLLPQIRYAAVPIFTVKRIYRVTPLPARAGSGVTRRAGP